VDVRGETAYVTRVVHHVSKEEVEAFAADCFAAGEAVGSFMGGFITGCVRVLSPVVRITAKGVVHVSVFTAKQIAKTVIELKAKRLELAEKQPLQIESHSQPAIECEVTEGRFIASAKPNTDKQDILPVSLLPTANADIVRRALAQTQLNSQNAKPFISPPQSVDYVAATPLNRAMPLHSFND
jgi:hypothetical protein